MSNPSVSDVTVTLGYTGTATSGSDYSAGAGSIVITAGNTTGTTSISALDDAITEGDETVIIDITGVTNGTESGTQQETVTITDDESAPTVTLSTDLATITEAGLETSVITATLSNPSVSDVTVTLGYTGTATSGSDYSAGAGSIVITAGNTTGTTSISALDDAITEGDETVIIDITAATTGTDSGTQQETLTHTDDDSAPTGT